MNPAYDDSHRSSFVRQLEERNLTRQRSPHPDMQLTLINTLHYLPIGYSAGFGGAVRSETRLHNAPVHP